MERAQKKGRERGRKGTNNHTGNWRRNNSFFLVPCGNIASSFSSLKKSYQFRAAIRPVTFFGVVQGRFAILCACMAALHRIRQAHHSEKNIKEENEGEN